MCIFSFQRHCQAIFQSNFNNSHSHQQECFWHSKSLSVLLLVYFLFFFGLVSLFLNLAILICLYEDYHHLRCIIMQNKRYFEYIFIICSHSKSFFCSSFFLLGFLPYFIFLIHPMAFCNRKIYLLLLCGLLFSLKSISSNFLTFLKHFNLNAFYIYIFFHFGLSLSSC